MSTGSASVAFVFPGQGSQVVGMGADIYAASPAARAVFNLADAALGFPLSKLCFEGPEDALRETINTQPALVATSLALLAALQEAAGQEAAGTSVPEGGTEPPLAAPLTPGFVAGHSVGEYAALVAAGAFDISAAIRLVRERGRLMHEEGQRVQSGMAAVLGLDAPKLEVICAEASRDTLAALGPVAEAPGAHPGLGRVVLANDNAPGQIVISGALPALERAMALAKDAGARRVVPLVVSGAFHSPVMAPASAQMAQVVASAPIAKTRIPVISNITAEPLTSAQAIREELGTQVASPVQWTRDVEYLAQAGVRVFVEIGAGSVLTGLIKRIAKGATLLNVSSAADIAPVVQQLRAHLDIR